MLFKDRRDGGMQLVPHLLKYKKDPEAIVIGLPRGGVVTAYEIAKGLGLPLDVICPRKIGAPFNPELAIGAITETGEGIFHEHLINELGVSADYIEQEIEKETAQAQRRLKLFRKGLPSRNLSGKIVIIVDDGLATGATMLAAIQSVRASGAKKIIVAVPVSPPDTLEKIRQQVDEAIALDVSPFFSAVGQFYKDFSQTEDQEVIELLEQLNRH